MDNKPLSFISNVLKAAWHKNVKRRTTVNGSYRQILVRQSVLVHDYNMNMAGVDRSDQLFFHLLVVARVNSLITYNVFRGKKW